MAAAASSFEPRFAVRPTAGLPALAVASGSAGSAAAARKGPVQATGEASEVRVRILVVDPDERARSILEARLAAEGFDVVGVESGRAAVRRLAPGRPLPAVIVSEVELTGTDGIALCDELRADERTAQIPFILLSRGSEWPQGESQGLTSADMTLAKPVFANDVVTAVQLWSERRAGERVIETSTDRVPLARALRLLLSTTRSGRLDAERGKAQLSFREGRVIDASFDGLGDNEAVARMMMLAEGPYTIGFGPALARATCSLGLEELCARMFPRLARWQQLLLRSLPLEAVTTVDFKRLAEELDRLPEGINQILRLFDGRRPVRDVVRECGLGEVTTLEAVNRLYAMGLLAPLPSGVEAPDELALRVPVVQLFEPVAVADVRMADLFGEGVPQPSDPAPAGEDWFDDVTPSQAQQIDAFHIQPVVEPAEAPPSIRVSPPAQPAQPTPVESAYDALESGFFADSPDAQVTPLARPAPAAPKPGWRLDRAAVMTFGTSFGLALLLGLAVWQISARISKRPTAVVAPAPTVAAPVAPVVAAPPDPLLAQHTPAAEVAPTFNEGVALYEAGKADDAAVVLARVVDADPKFADAWLMLGLARFDSNDTVGAHDAATRASELDPKSGRVHMLLASIFMDEKDRAKADDELKKYLELEPKGEFSAEAQQLLAKP